MNVSSKEQGTVSFGKSIQNHLHRTSLISRILALFGGSWTRYAQTPLAFSRKALVFLREMWKREVKVQDQCNIVHYARLLALSVICSTSKLEDKIASKWAERPFEARSTWMVLRPTARSFRAASNLQDKLLRVFLIYKDAWMLQSHGWDRATFWSIFFAQTKKINEYIWIIWTRELGVNRLP